MFSSSPIQLEACRPEAGQGIGFTLSWVKADNYDQGGHLG